MMKISLLFLVFLCFACSNNSNNQAVQKQHHLILTDSISFDVGMHVYSTYSGTFIDKQSKEELFYFADKTTHKKIKLFDDHAHFIEEISLKPALKKCSSIQGINFLSLDTIIVFTGCEHSLLFMNRKGEIFKQLSLDDLIQKNANDYYTFSAHPEGKFLINDSTIVFRAVWQKDSSVDVSNLTNYEYSLHCSKNAWKKNHLIIIHDVFDQKPIFDFNINTHLFPNFDSTIYVLGSASYCAVDDKILVWCKYSDKIFLMDTYTNILKEVAIECSKGKIGTQYFNIGKGNPNDIQSMLTNNMQLSQYIGKVLYDTVQKVYYIKVYNKITRDFFDKNQYKPFSILVYDKEFNKMDEIYFDNKKYQNMRLSTRGLMIGVKTEITDYKNQTVVFEIYNYEK